VRSKEIEKLLPFWVKVALYIFTVASSIARVLVVAGGGGVFAVCAYAAVPKEAASTTPPTNANTPRREKNWRMIIKMKY
jgi:hypothetical protein